MLLCSECFNDQGLRLDARMIGMVDSSTCPNCGATGAVKLDEERLSALAHRFFVWGSLLRSDYGAAPFIQFNGRRKTSITVPSWLDLDMRLIERTLGVGFFRYAPRLWMLGEVEPLKALQDSTSCSSIIARILSEYPERILGPDEVLYRIRTAPRMPDNPQEYDSPPNLMTCNGRLDSPGFPVMYASSDLQICIHECRVTAEDDLFVAALGSTSPLRLLDLSVLLTHEDVTEFESLDIAVHMLFLAGKHSYPITRKISLAAQSAGFDGLVFPSYFSLLRNGAVPFETGYGISYRRFPPMQGYEQSKVVPNLAIFGRPIESGRIQVRCINRLILRHVEYGVHFGPVGVA